MGDAVLDDPSLPVFIIPAVQRLGVVRLLRAVEQAQIVEERDELVRALACLKWLRRGSFTKANSDLILSQIEAGDGPARRPSSPGSLSDDGIVPLYI